MKVIFLLAFACLSAIWAQSAPPAAAAASTLPDLPDDTVVAVFGDGTKFTMGNFRKIYEALPPANQQMALRNREVWLHQWELLRKLTKMAETPKLAKKALTRKAWPTGGCMCCRRPRSVAQSTRWWWNPAISSNTT